MKLGLVSYKFDINSLNYNIKQIERAFKEASGKVDLLVFGETFLQGFSALSYSYGLDKEIAITVNSRIFKTLKEMTIQYKTDLLLGYYELDEDTENIYSSCALIESGRLVYNYRRLTPNWHDEGLDKHYKEGKVTEDFNYKGKDIMVALCGDLWISPERFKTNGLLIWPVYLNFNEETWKKEEAAYLAQAMVVSNEAVLVNSLSEHPKSLGNAFYFKDGKIIDSVGYDKEGILIVDLD